MSKALEHPIGFLTVEVVKSVNAGNPDNPITCSGDHLTRMAAVVEYLPSAGNLWAQPGVSDFERVS